MNGCWSFMAVIYFFIVFVCGLCRRFKHHLLFLWFLSASGAGCAPDGGRLSAPGLLLLWTESVGADHTFPPDQVLTRSLFLSFIRVDSFIHLRTFSSTKDCFQDQLWIVQADMFFVMF